MFDRDKGGMPSLKRPLHNVITVGMGVGHEMEQGPIVDNTVQYYNQLASCTPMKNHNILGE